MNRRELLKALAAGGVITAAGLWMPGTKLISIPKFQGHSLDILLMHSGKEMYRWTESIEKRFIEGGTSYHAREDPYIEIDKTFAFNEVHVANPYSIGPKSTSIHKEHLSVAIGDTLTIRAIDNNKLLVVT